MRRIWISNLGLVLVLVIGVVYVLFNVVRIDPTKTLNTVHVNLGTSGGLLERADVTYLGVPIGRVEQVRLRKDGVVARISLDSDVKVPANTEAVVAGLSAAGEQHLDLRPRVAGGPFLADGAVIKESDTRTPRPFAELLAHVGSISDQLDPKLLGIVVDELSTATDGGAPAVRRILTDGRFLLTGLEDVLPETVSILNNGHKTLTTVADLTDELKRLGTAGKTVGRALEKADPDVRRLLAKSPEALQVITDFVAENQEGVGALFDDMTKVTALVDQRLPAFSQYLPGLLEVGKALPIVSHDGALKVVGDISSKPMCSYDVPRRMPWVGGTPEPYTDLHCREYGPELQQRGSYNAPSPGEPAGDRSSTSGNAPSTARGSVSAENWNEWYLERLIGG